MNSFFLTKVFISFIKNIPLKLQSKPSFCPLAIFAYLTHVKKKVTSPRQDSIWVSEEASKPQKILHFFFDGIPTDKNFLFCVNLQIKWLPTAWFPKKKHPHSHKFFVYMLHVEYFYVMNFSFERCLFLLEENPLKTNRKSMFVPISNGTPPFVCSLLLWEQLPGRSPKAPGSGNRAAPVNSPAPSSAHKVFCFWALLSESHTNRNLHKTN